MIIYEYLVKILSFKMSEEMLRPYRYFFLPHVRSIPQRSPSLARPFSPHVVGVFVAACGTPQSDCGTRCRSGFTTCSAWCGELVSKHLTESDGHQSMKRGLV